MPKPKHGGKRPGAGRPPGALNRRTVASNEAGRAIPHCATPVAFLTLLMAHAGIDTRLRLDAAKALMPYVHAQHFNG